MGEHWYAQGTVSIDDLNFICARGVDFVLVCERGFECSCACLRIGMRGRSFVRLTREFGEGVWVCALGRVASNVPPPPTLAKNLLCRLVCERVGRLGLSGVFFPPSF